MCIRDRINRVYLNWEDYFRVNDYYFPYSSGHPASCIIKDDGIIIYNLSYVIYEDFELEEYYKENEICKDDYEDDEEQTSLIEEGIFHEQDFFHREINADYLMGFLDYISKLYNNANYTGDIMVKFKVIGIENCLDYHNNSKFRQNLLEPIEKIYSQEIIQKDPIKVVKDFFNPILAGFGYLPINLQEFYSNVEHNKLLRQ